MFQWVRRYEIGFKNRLEPEKLNRRRKKRTGCTVKDKMAPNHDPSLIQIM